jgi:hypothetical protein
MEEPILSLNSTIHSSIKKATLIKGTIYGAAGMSLWLYGGIFLSPSVLATWGWVLLLLGGVFITLGLLPYRQLSYLENTPHQVKVDSLNELYFALHGRILFKVSLEKVDGMAYLDDDKHYGIGLWIAPTSKDITALHYSLDLPLYVEENQKKYFCDLFLPYFSKRSYYELEEIYRSLKKGSTKINE